MNDKRAEEVGPPFRLTPSLTVKVIAVLNLLVFVYVSLGWNSMLHELRERHREVMLWLGILAFVTLSLSGISILFSRVIIYSNRIEIRSLTGTFRRDLSAITDVEFSTEGLILTFDNRRKKTLRAAPSRLDVIEEFLRANCNHLLGSNPVSDGV